MRFFTREKVPRVAQASVLWDSPSRRILLRATERSRFNPSLGKENTRPNFGGTPKSTRGTRVLP
jgi:hypothetical protein